MGAPLATRLFADGIGAVDVPAKLATRVRMLSTGHGRKNDASDAVSVAVAALTAAGLRAVAVDRGGAVWGRSVLRRSAKDGAAAGRAGIEGIGSMSVAIRYISMPIDG